MVLNRDEITLTISFSGCIDQIYKWVILKRVDIKYVTSMDFHIRCVVDDNVTVALE